MIIGETLISESSSGTVYFSPWFPRGGNAATFACNVLRVGADMSTLEIQVQTKNHDDNDDSAANIGSNQSITLTANTVTKWDVGSIDIDGGTGVAGFSELVRFKYTVSSAVSPTNLPAWVHFRMLAAAWVTD